MFKYFLRKILPGYRQPTVTEQFEMLIYEQYRELSSAISSGETAANLQQLVTLHNSELLKAFVRIKRR